MLDDHILKDWISKLENSGRRLSTLAKRISEVNQNPFLLSEELRKGIDIIKDVASIVPEVLAEMFKEECQIEEAGFWQELSAAASAEGWELHGSTSRRLLART